jgi:hypothetical protein
MASPLFFTDLCVLCVNPLKKLVPRTLFMYAPLLIVIILHFVLLCFWKFWYMFCLFSYRAVALSNIGYNAWYRLKERHILKLHI